MNINKITTKVSVFFLFILVTLIFSGETLFEVKNDAGDPIMSVQDDGVWILNSAGDTLMTVNNDSIRFTIESNDRALRRSFAIKQAGSRSGNTRVDGSNIMKISSANEVGTYNDSIMLWYPKKNAFRVNYVYISEPEDVGHGSVATGYHSLASGKYSTALGDSSEASGYASFAVGRQSIASGRNSIALGALSQAEGHYSTAFGYGLASGYGAVSFGGTASGSGSFSMGGETLASGVGSNAWGWRTTAQARSSFVIGQLNVIEGNPTHWAGTTDPVFVIGNGYEGMAGTVRQNALTVRQNGNMEVAGTLTLENGTDANELSTDGTLSGNSDSVIPTEKAVKTYVDNNSGGYSPIAIGNISSTGAINSGSGNFTCSWNSTYNRYEISISGYSYYYTTYIAIVTPYNYNYQPATTSSGGKLLVYIYNSAGSKVQGMFQFVAYKP